MNHKLKTTKNHWCTPGVLVILAAATGCFAVMVLATTADAQVPPAATAPGGSIEQRIAQRKAERNVVITTEDKSRLESSCSSAQTKLRSLQQTTTPVVLERAKANLLIDAKLWVIIGKLKLAEKDTFALEKQRATLAEKVRVFAETERLYQQTLDDAIVLNCKADLVGFKAMLDTARIYRTQVRDQSTDIRNYLVNDIKPSLNAFSAQLQGKQTTGGTQ